MFNLYLLNRNDISATYNLNILLLPEQTDKFTDLKIKFTPSAVYAHSNDNIKYYKS